MKSYYEENDGFDGFVDLLDWCIIKAESSQIWKKFSIDDAMAISIIKPYHVFAFIQGTIRV